MVAVSAPSRDLCAGRLLNTTHFRHSDVHEGLMVAVLVRVFPDILVLIFLVTAGLLPGYSCGVTRPPLCRGSIRSGWLALCGDVSDVRGSRVARLLAMVTEMLVCISLVQAPL